MLKTSVEEIAILDSLRVLSKSIVVVILCLGYKFSLAIALQEKLRAMACLRGLKVFEQEFYRAEFIFRLDSPPSLSCMQDELVIATLGMTSCFHPSAILYDKFKEVNNTFVLLFGFSAKSTNQLGSDVNR